jgi:hypothetical protein
MRSLPSIGGWVVLSLVSLSGCGVGVADETELEQSPASSAPSEEELGESTQDLTAACGRGTYPYASCVNTWFGWSSAEIGCKSRTTGAKVKRQLLSCSRSCSVSQGYILNGCYPGNEYI